MAEDNYGWLFVDNTPLLYNKKNVDRQKKIETWLDLYQLTKELKINKSEIREKTKSKLKYII
jgi:maltose-binding protein MalE